MKSLRYVLALLALICFVPNAHAQISPEIGELAGVYKDSFQNGLIDGTTYSSENILEFVAVRDTIAYLKLHLEFYNGHECNVAGIVRQEKDQSFLFQDPDIEASCMLEMKKSGDTIKFSDLSGNCQKFCGARGGFSGTSFDIKQKRQIRYMDKILKSPEYTEAVTAYDARHRK